MKKGSGNNGRRHLLFGWIIAVGLYISLLLPGAAPMERVIPPSQTTPYSTDSFTCQLFRIDSTIVLSETGPTPAPIFKVRVDQGSIHSQTAHDLIESEDADYMERILITLIQPQVFDILFPFHYYS